MKATRSPTRSTGLGLAVRVFALDGLDSGLLVNGQHDRPLGCPAVQGADLVDLLAELRVGAVQPLSHAVRAQVARLQNALQVATADLLDHAALDGTLHQLVQRGRRTSLQFGRLAGQGQQFQPLRLTDTP